MDPTCGLVDGLVGKFRGIVVDLTWEQLLYFFCYDRNIDQLKGQYMELTLERSSIQHLIDEAKNNGEQIEEKVLHWLREVDRLSEQVKKFQEEESQAKIACIITSCFNLWPRYELSKRAKAMTEEADNMYAKRHFNRISYRVPLPSIVELTNRQGNVGMDSRVPIMNQILEELGNPSVNVIGLCGLPGVGKTTIAKEVAKNQKIFEKVIVALVSRELNIEKIQGQIAEKLNMKFTENNKDVRAFRLCERLKQEKNMLLILDDLWEELDLGEVGIPLFSVENCSKKNEGCKVLLTSRNKMLLLDIMKCQKIVEVGVLSKNEALELFKKIAELSIDSSSELISIATDIVRKCGGLPLAIATTAKALRNKDISVWKDALARLSNPFRRNNTLTRDVDTILKWSYDRLSTLEYKNIFLLAAMLSHDPSIEDLLMYSVGLDILKHTQNLGDARNAIFQIVGKLKSLNLFLDSFYSHHFTMHDVFRDFTLSVASKEFNAVIVWHMRLNEWPDESDLEHCKGICLQESDICDLPEELNGPILEFFLLNSKKSDLTIPNTFFKSSKKLKVLAITKVHFSSLPSLSFLQSLKALCLHSCLLDDITEIRSLRKLKVLSLAYSEIQRLPAEVAELTSLQILNLSHCSKLQVIPHKLLSSLKKLEVLYMRNSFNQWKVEKSSKADENASLDELMDLPISSLEIHIPNLSMLPKNFFLKMNLRRYRIFIGKSWEWQGKYGASKILKLELESSIDLTPRLKNLSEGVEDLHLYGSNGQENVLYNLDDIGFPHFGQLHTLKMENLSALIGDFSIKDKATKSASNKTFKSLFNKVLLPKLEILELSNLNILIPLIWDDQLLHNSFHNLKTLTVEKCGFVKLVPLHVLKSLNNLEKVDVKFCNMLEIVFDFEDLNDYYKEMDSSSVVVPLKKLRLSWLPKLKNVWSDHYQGNVSFPSLSSVDVYECESLTSIFPASIAKGMLGDQVSESVAVTFGFPRLTSLQLFGLPNLRNFYTQKHTLDHNQLSIHCCDELEIFEKEVSGSSEIYEEGNLLDSKYPLLSHDKVLLPKLERLKLSNLNSLFPWIWDSQLLHNSFNNLKTLTVEKFGFVKFVPLHVLKSLNNLEEVEVGSCAMLEILFDFEDLSYKEMESSSVVVPLKKLKLSNLPKLKNVWSDHYQGNVSFPILRSVDVYKCERLTSIFPASIAKGMLCNLEELEIRRCGVDVIIAKDQVLESVAVTFGFPRLTSLILYGLPNLRNFYPQKHTLEWPHLNRLSIQCCDELEIFEQEVSGSSEIYKEENMLDSKYPLLPHHKVIGNLERLTLQGKEVEKIGSGQFLMYHFPKLKLLHLSHEKEPSFTFWERSPNLGELKLSGDFEKDLRSDNVVALAACFPKLTLEKISIMQSLSPSLVSSPNLTHLNVNSCLKWTTLMTLSIARSLVHLTHLSISNCYEMMEIITKQEEEDDEDKEIFFIKMKFLELDNLPRLKRFCGYNYTFKFFLLEQLIINKCPKFKIFSHGLIETQSLKSVQLWQDWRKHDEIWDTDLNKTLYRQQFVPSREVVLDEDDAFMIKNEQFPADRCPQVVILGIDGFFDEWLTFWYTLFERFPKLNALHVKKCSFEEIFPSHAPSSTSFHNLTELKVSRCHQLVYLVTCSTVKSLVNLEILEIDDCKKMEEIVRNETNENVEQGITFNELRILKLTRLPKLKTQEDKKDFNIGDRATNTGCTNIHISLFSHNKVLLPKLETLELSYLSNNLISLVWGDQLLHNPFNNLKSLMLEGCDFMKMVPLNALKYINNLEKLEVSYCHKLEMVFGFEDLNDYHKEMESSSVVVPLSLTHLEVKGCRGLTSLMTSSAAPSLVHITHLSISDCDQIEEIITKQEGEDDEDKEIIFNQMKFLELDDLPRLERFCGDNYTFRFPLLEHVTITECLRLTMFCPGAIHAPRLQSIQVDKYEAHKCIWMTDLNNTIQHLFTFEEVISTCSSMALNSKNITMITDVFPEVSYLYVESFTDEGVTFPYSSLEKFPQLNWLNVEHCSFEEIFPSQDQIIDFMGKVSPFDVLCIADMDKLKRIWNDDSQLPPIHQNLTYLRVESCCSLVQLAPSSPSFQNLEELFVFGCDQLIHLVTTSTAKNLVSLWWLEIDDCKRMEEIVMNDTNEDVQAGITFNRLCSIKLTDMPSLKMFSPQSHTFEFPELKYIEISGCTEMKKFCRGVLKTPKLSSVKIEEHDMEWKEEDLNKIMEGLSSAKASMNI